MSDWRWWPSSSVSASTGSSRRAAGTIPPRPRTPCARSASRSSGTDRERGAVSGSAVDDEQARVARALAQRAGRGVLLAAVPRGRGVEGRELQDHDAGRRRALERLDIAAAGEVPPAGGGYRRGRRGLVALVLLGVGDDRLVHDVCAHGRYVVGVV